MSILDAVLTVLQFVSVVAVAVSFALLLIVTAHLCVQELLDWRWRRSQGFPRRWAESREQEWL